MNPLLWKEIKVGTRERRIFVFHVLFMLFVSVVALWRLFSVDRMSDYIEFAEAGRTLHAVLVLVILGLLLLITPALTAGSLSSERERMSLDLLLSSGATPAQIVGGKSAYAVAYMGLLLISAMPLDSLTLFLGGVSPLGFLLTYALLGGVVLVLAEMGLFVSAREKRTAYATTQAYGLLGLSIMGLLFATAWLGLSPADFLSDAAEGPLAGACLFNLLCLAGFLRLKARNHLSVRLGHLVGMALLVVVWYLADCAMLGLWLRDAYVGAPDEPFSELWAVQLVVGLVLLGCFLDRPRLEIPSEERRFRRSLLATPYPWVLLLAVGTAVTGSLAARSGADPQQFVTHTGQMLLYGLALVAVGRATASAAGPNVPGAVAYFTACALLFAAPTLGLLHSLESRSPGEIWHLVWLSPYFASRTLVQADYLGIPMSVLVAGEPVTMAMASAFGMPVVVGVVGLLGLLVARRRSRRSAT